MPLQLPELDSRNFQSLMQDMIASIPKYSKEWTNYNPSEAGMILLELLAWVTENLMYRTNLVPDESYLNFLKLVAGSKQADQGMDTIEDAARDRLYGYLDQVQAAFERGERLDITAIQAEAQRFLNSKFRAVTEADFKEIICEKFDDVKRVEVVCSDQDAIEIIIIPNADPEKRPDMNDLCKNVADYLEPRLLLGTLYRLQPAQYQELSLQIEVNYADDYLAKKETVTVELRAKISGFLNSVSGGPDGAGWPYGMDLVVYDLYYVVDQVKGVNINVINYKNPDTQNWYALDKLPVTGLIDLSEIDIKEIS